MKEYAVASPAQIEIKVNQAPIKGSAEQLVSPDLLKQQADAAARCLTPVDYHTVRGSCSDERGRDSLRNGESTEPRPDIFGGPDIYALAVAELIGYFVDDGETGSGRLRKVKHQLNEAELLSGGHDGCAANAGFPVWMALILENDEAVKQYAQSQLGGRYDETLASEVIGFARQLVESKRYVDWQENNLADVYGAEAGEAIEQLEDVSHEGLTLIRNRLEGVTVDQTELYNQSIVGKGSFIIDDCYADQIEHVLSSGPDAVRQKQMAEHAREIIIAAIVIALPNPELYQIDLLPR